MKPLSKAASLAAAPIAAKVEAAKVEAAADTEASLESMEREHILRILRETNRVVGGAKGAAARLGLKRTTLQSRMRKLGIDRYRSTP
jgi:transcriptional regulator with GAF, ATPase, and Fis domain